MTDEKSLAEFEATNMGWLTDAGELLPCPLHGHMARLAAVPRFEEPYRRYQGICEANADYVQHELDSLGPDEHPAMHRFHGMDDDAKDEFVKVVYQAGWVRLGRSYDAAGVLEITRRERVSSMQALKHRSVWYVEAEGLTEAVRGHRRVLEGIARDLGSRLVLREMKYAEVNFGSRRHPKVRELLVPEAFRQDVD